MKGSLGLIETRGLVPAIAAADAGVKAANVSLLECKLTWPALVTITFQGDVAAVQAAVASGSAVANAVGEVVSTHVIARPYADFDQVTPTPFTGQDDASEGQKQEKVIAVSTVREEPKTKQVSKRTVTKRSPRASAKQKAAPVKKTTSKPAAPKKAPGKKVATQGGSKSAQVKAGDVEAGVHDTDTTNKKVATGTGTVEKRTDKTAAESAQQTQKTGATRSATKTAQRKRAVASRKRPVRKRQATTTQKSTTAPSAQSTAEKVSQTTEKGQATTGRTSPEKSTTKPTDKK